MQLEILAEAEQRQGISVGLEMQARAAHPAAQVGRDIVCSVVAVSGTELVEVSDVGFFKVLEVSGVEPVDVLVPAFVVTVSVGSVDILDPVAPGSVVGPLGSDSPVGQQLLPRSQHSLPVVQQTMAQQTGYSSGQQPSES